MAESAGGGWIFTMKDVKIMKIISRIKRIFWAEEGKRQCSLNRNFYYKAAVFGVKEFFMLFLESIGFDSSSWYSGLGAIYTCRRP